MKQNFSKEEKAVIVAYTHWCKTAKREPDGRDVATLLQRSDIESIESINSLIDKYMAENVTYSHHLG